MGGRKKSKEKYGGLKFVQKNYGDLKIFSLKIRGCENKKLLRGHSKSTFKFLSIFDYLCDGKHLGSAVIRSKALKNGEKRPKTGENGLFGHLRKM